MKNANKLWDQLLKEEKQQTKAPETESASLNIQKALEAVKNANKKQTIVEKVRFAGQVYLYIYLIRQEKEATSKDIKKVVRIEKSKLKGSQDGLDKLVSIIDDKAKSISTLTKSKKDWNDYTEKQQMQADLKRKRMDGHISKTLFLEKAATSEREFRKKKAL